MNTATAAQTMNIHPEPALVPILGTCTECHLPVGQYAQRRILRDASGATDCWTGGPSHQLTK